MRRKLLPPGGVIVPSFQDHFVKSVDQTDIFCLLPEVLLFFYKKLCYFPYVLSAVGFEVFNLIIFELSYL